MINPAALLRIDYRVTKGTSWGRYCNYAGEKWWFWTWWLTEEIVVNGRLLIIEAGRLVSDMGCEEK